MSRTRIWILSCAILLLVLAGVAALRRADHAPSFTSKLEGRPVIALWLNPDSQESLTNLQRNDADFFHSWRILAQKELSKDEILRVRQVLEQASNYGGSAEKCFETEAAFRFGPDLEVLISSKCHRIQVVETHPNPIAESHTLSAEGAANVSRLLQELLPNPTSK
jgi:hypothetical protein